MSRNDAFNRINCALDNIADWINDNKDILAVGIPTGLWALSEGRKLMRAIDHRKFIKRERELRDLYVYDNRTNVYYRIRRPMTNSQKMELARRKRNGEYVDEILLSMRLL